MTASVGSWMVGSGTSSTRMSFLPCQVTAFMSFLLAPGRSAAGARCPPAPERNGRRRLGAVLTSASQRTNTKLREVAQELVDRATEPSEARTRDDDPAPAS